MGVDIYLFAAGHFFILAKNKDVLDHLKGGRVRPSDDFHSSGSGAGHWANVAGGGASEREGMDQVLQTLQGMCRARGQWRNQLLVRYSLVNQQGRIFPFFMKKCYLLMAFGLPQFLKSSLQHLL